MELRLCQPASIILLVSVAGILYHLLTMNFVGMLYWVLVGVVGTGVFQTLCYVGYEPIAWLFMLIPVLLVCFFLAVALFASSMRINNVRRVPCDRCGNPKKPCGCKEENKRSNKVKCNRTRNCGGCDQCLGNPYNDYL